jgi:hypothetical protein
MLVKRYTPQHGLLAGLLALVTFASGAVAMTAHGSSPALSTPPPQVTGAVAAAADGDGPTTFAVRDRDGGHGRDRRGR